MQEGITLTMVTYNYVNILVLTNAEECTINDDCKNSTVTTCGRNFHEICEHKHEEGVTHMGGLCTCAANDYGNIFCFVTILFLTLFPFYIINYL